MKKKVQVDEAVSVVEEVMLVLNKLWLWKRRWGLW